MSDKEQAARMIREVIAQLVEEGYHYPNDELMKLCDAANLLDGEREEWEVVDL